MRKIIRAFKQLWRLASPYWFKSEDRAGSWALLVADVALMLVSVIGSIRINIWYAAWTNAYVNSDRALWNQQLAVFALFAAVVTISGGLRHYLDQWIAIRWRRWMSSQFIDNWMTGYNHYRMQFTGSKTDNPDQRISEDINQFLDFTWRYTFNLLQNLLTLGSFIVILWNLSATIPMILFGRDWSFPGYFIVIAFVWAVIGTYGAHFFGRALIGITYDQRRYEADFRFSLVQIRENSEQISLLGGEKVEHQRVMGIFNNVIANTFRMALRRMKLQFITLGFSFADGVIISILLGPAYFMGAIPGGYGSIMQIANAFQQVLITFKFFQSIYADLAIWKAVVNRLVGFLDSHREAEEITKESKVEIDTRDTDDVAIPQMDIYLPNGQLQVVAKNMVLKPGDKILIKGKTGAGKTTLFRVIAGLWPFGHGSVIIPKNKRIIVLPQKPYIPIGTLAEVVSYPNPPEMYSREEIEQILRDVDLENFIDRLDEEAHWSRILSGGEQQRVGIARAMLYKPDFLFFDEATASMDEPSEETLYNMLLERLKNTTIISIGHRSSLQKFHERLFVAEQQPEGYFEFMEREMPSGFDSVALDQTS